MVMVVGKHVGRGMGVHAEGRGRRYLVADDVEDGDGGRRGGGSRHALLMMKVGWMAFHGQCESWSGDV